MAGTIIKAPLSNLMLLPKMKWHAFQTLLEHNHILPFVEIFGGEYLQIECKNPVQEECWN